jgi:hypothetical protein
MQYSQMDAGFHNARLETDTEHEEAEGDDDAMPAELDSRNTTSVVNSTTPALVREIPFSVAPNLSLYT